MKNKLSYSLIPSQTCGISNEGLDIKYSMERAMNDAINFRVTRVNDLDGFLDSDFMKALNETTKKVGKDKPTKERL